VRGVGEVKERRRWERKPHSVSMGNYGNADTPDHVFFAVMSGKLFLLTEHIKEERKESRKKTRKGARK